VTFVSGLYFFLEYILPEKIGDFRFGLHHSHISRGFIVIGTMAIGLGLINILRVHGTAVLRARKGWGNSLALLLGLIVMLAVEGGDFLSSEARVTEWKSLADLKEYSERIRSDFIDEQTPAGGRMERLIQVVDQLIARSSSHDGYLHASIAAPASEKKHTAFLDSLTQVRTDALTLSEAYYENEKLTEEISLTEDLSQYQRIADAHVALRLSLATAAEKGDDISRTVLENAWIVKAKNLLSNAFLFPLGAAMFSLLAFYIATAAYRSFRIRSAEAFIMMLAAVIVILGQIPHGPIYVSEHLPIVRLWLLKNLSTPAFRAIYFGAALAGLAMAVRMWLSLEQSPLATEEEGS
jgi:hypothetical protein